MIMTSLFPPSAIAHLTDTILIVISGSAVFYCAMLNRRLKKLSNLKTGVGASILTLTQAIEQTHQAAQETQSATLQTTQTLRHLLNKAESETPKAEALVTDLVRAQKLARIQIENFESELDAALAPVIKESRHVAKVLLAVIAEAKRQSEKLSVNVTARDLAVPVKPKVAPAIKESTTPNLVRVK